METVHATPKISLFGELVKDVEIRAPAGKFHHMFAARPHHMSKATPNNIQGCDLLEGEWGKVGTIVIWYYFIDGQPKKSKDRIEAVEPEKNLITFRVIEGDLMNEFKSFVLTIQVTPKQGRPGSVVYWHVKYEKIDKNVAHPDNMLPFFESMSKEIDEHLLSEK